MLQRMLTLVERFNREITGKNIPTVPTILSPERVKAAYEAFIEEDKEFLEADTMEKQADALVDGIYFRMGYILEMGILPGPIFDEVHEANMMKKRGMVSTRPNSQGFDAVKPEGWKAPDLTPYLTITKSDFLRLMHRMPKRRCLTPHQIAVEEASGMSIDWDLVARMEASHV